MDRQIGMHAEGRLSLCEGGGDGEGLGEITVRVEPLTFVLSPSARGEAGRKH